MFTAGIKAFYSDPHFGHKNIIRFADRPYFGVKKMEQELIWNYNQMISDDDWVCWVGDCFLQLSFTESQHILDALNGHKILVKGNHDRLSNLAYLKMGFSLVADQLETIVADRKCIVAHYPYMPTDKTVARLKAEGISVDTRYPERRPVYQKGQCLIHGHTHSAEKFIEERNMVHIGVDAWNYSPAPMNEVEDIVRGFYE